MPTNSTIFLSFVSNLPEHIYWFAGLLIVLAAGFLLFYVLPAFSVFFRIRGATHALADLADNKTEVNKDSLAATFRGRGVLEHLWSEYYETLHKQTEVDPATGMHRIVQLRSTVPAEALFNPEVIVNIPLRVDFFKHLPGIFTGVGIIGTFYGLINGLSKFQISENPEEVRSSLDQLLHGVWEAFLVSASAIAIAIIVTFIEKIIATALHARVEYLVQKIDGLFEAGAGEEYLARLVKSSEFSASQTAILKDALVGDLKQILVDLADKQIAASQANADALGDRFKTSFEGGVKDPLDKIAEVFKDVRSDQGGAVKSLLEDVLTAFSAQLEKLFGGQISGINELQQQTIKALGDAVAKLEAMAKSVDTAGKNGANAMAEKLQEAMAAAEARQKLMNDKMAEFVDQMSAALKKTDTETSAALQNTLLSLSEQIEKVAQRLGDQAIKTGDVSKKNQDDMANEYKRFVGELSTNVLSMVASVVEASAEMRSAVDAMKSITSEALGKLNTSADTLYIAASDFAKAGDGVTGALDKSTALAVQLNQAAGAVVSASTNLGGVLTDYRAARDSISDLVTTLDKTIENARRDAAVSQDLISRMESAASKLADAQHQAEDFLANVVKVIGDSHGEFTQGMTRALAEANRDFHRALSDSVKLLREGIQELEGAFDTAPRRKES